MTNVQDRPRTGMPERRPGELGLRELGRWAWRQLTSMRTALVLLLMLALAAVPGSVIPQSGVDALNVSRWKDQHPTLTPIYERFGLFSVYDSAWFSAIYLLLMISLVGCIIPRSLVYLRGLRAVPPAAPRNLTRLPDHATFETDEDVDVVVARAQEVLGKRRYRLRPADSDSDTATGSRSVSAERGYLREFGNLVFHCSVIVVLVGFALGGLLGYQGGVILIRGQTFANSSASYDDFNPGSLFGAEDLDPFLFSVDDFDVTFLTKGSSAGTARKFNASLTYQDSPTAAEQHYDLRVNHPLTIDNTDVFLIGHGYAPKITVRDGNGDIAYSGPTPFLPQDQSFLSFGVVKVPFAQPNQIALQGLLYPTFQLVDGDPQTIWPDDLEPLISMSVYTGDIGVSSGKPQSIYLLDTSKATQVMKADGRPERLDLQLGETATLPNGLGSVTFDGVEPWVKIQISQSPGKRIALGGVILALIGLLGSLFIRPRRVWVRVRKTGEQGGVTMVEVAALDRSGGGDVSEVLDEIVAALQGSAEPVTGKSTEENDV